MIKNKFCIMKEEGKKRWRPSLTAYRALENEVSVLSERARKAEGITEEYKVLRCKHDLLEKSNRWLEDRVVEMSQQIRSLELKNDELCNEIYRLEKRGLWARLCNK